MTSNVDSKNKSIMYMQFFQGPPTILPGGAQAISGYVLYGVQ